LKAYDTNGLPKALLSKVGCTLILFTQGFKKNNITTNNFIFFVPPNDLHAQNLHPLSRSSYHDTSYTMAGDYLYPKTKPYHLYEE